MPDPQPSQPAAGEAKPPAAFRHNHAGRHRCQVCSRSFGAHELLPGGLVRESIAALIAKQVPGWDPSGMICHNCLNRFRMDYVRTEMESDRGELSSVEEEVMRRIGDGALIAENLNPEYDRSLTFGERVADRVAEFGGSWRFIIVFFAQDGVDRNQQHLLAVSAVRPVSLYSAESGSVAAGGSAGAGHHDEPEPTGIRDRLRAENDYQVNLKAELEVRALGEKMDLLIHQHWAHLLEIQQVQTEMIQDMLARLGR